MRACAHVRPCVRECVNDDRVTSPSLQRLYAILICVRSPIVAAHLAACSSCHALWGANVARGVWFKIAVLVVVIPTIPWPDGHPTVPTRPHGISEFRVGDKVEWLRFCRNAFFIVSGVAVRAFRVQQGVME